MNANLLWSCSVLLFFQPHLALRYQRFLPFLRSYWCRLPLFSFWMISVNPGIVQWYFLNLTHSAIKLLNKWLYLTHPLSKHRYNRTYIWVESSYLSGVDIILVVFKTENLFVLLISFPFPIFLEYKIKGWICKFICKLYSKILFEFIIFFFFSFFFFGEWIQQQASLKKLIKVWSKNLTVWSIKSTQKPSC